MGASDERGAGKTAESTAVAISKLWIPVGIFLFFLLSIFSREELLDRFLGNASTIVRQVFEYGTQIGLWLSAAFLVQRLITVFIWDGLISGISGRPIPMEAELTEHLKKGLLVVVSTIEGLDELSPAGPPFLGPVGADLPEQGLGIGEGGFEIGLWLDLQEMA